jgi:hypothetical protein
MYKFRLITISQQIFGTIRLILLKCCYLKHDILYECCVKSVSAGFRTRLLGCFLGTFCGWRMGALGGISLYIKRLIKAKD